MLFETAASSSWRLLSFVRNLLVAVDETALSSPAHAGPLANETDTRSHSCQRYCFYHAECWTDEMSTQNLHRQYVVQSMLWGRSEEQKALVKTIREKIFPNQMIGQLDSAICLGLGSLENSEWDYPAGEVPVSVALGIVERSRDVNRAIQFLLTFETILSVLREKYQIPTVRFQDPTFTQIDCVFLKEKGYVLVPYPISKRKEPLEGSYDPPDLQLMTNTTQETFFFIPPRLDRRVLEQYISYASPWLFWGERIRTAYMNPAKPHILVSSQLCA